MPVGRVGVLVGVLEGVGVCDGVGAVPVPVNEVGGVAGDPSMLMSSQYTGDTFPTESRYWTST